MSMSSTHSAMATSHSSVTGMSMTGAHGASSVTVGGMSMTVSHGATNILPDWLSTCATCWTPTASGRPGTQVMC
jgi:hypothetical protein